MLREKNEELELGLILNHELCQKFKEKYIPFGFEKNMPAQLREFCGKLEGIFKFLKQKFDQMLFNFLIQQS